jgi:hypothetical protein
MHRSYSDEKSAVETGGGSLELAGTPTLSHMPPLTMLAYVGEAGGGGGEREQQLTSSLPSRITYDPRGGGDWMAGGEAR